MADGLDTRERAQLEAHLDECAECLELVTLAARTSFAAVDCTPSLREGDRADEDGGAALTGALVGRYEIRDAQRRAADFASSPPRFTASVMEFCGRRAVSAQLSTLDSAIHLRRWRF